MRSYPFVAIEAILPKAAGRRLDDSVDGDDDDIYGKSISANACPDSKDYRSKMELKHDHANRPLWVTPG